MDPLWKQAKETPECAANKWSDEVVVLTNYGNVYLISYYNGSDSGVWQRPAKFEKGECVECWIEKPK